MKRFYVPKIVGEFAYASDTESLHIKKVLRLKPGDKALLFDNTGHEYVAIISRFEGDNVIFKIENSILKAHNHLIKIVLYQAIIKNDNFSYVVQKCTELGAAEICPFISERCVKRPSSVENFAERYNKIAINAAKQCGRNYSPTICDITHISNICDKMDGNLKLLANESEKHKSIKNVLQSNSPQSIDVIIGPEGGFTCKEVNILKGHGVESVSLGNNILRAETAAPAALAMILYEYGL